MEGTLSKQMFGKFPSSYELIAKKCPVVSSIKMLISANYNKFRKGIFQPFKKSFQEEVLVGFEFICK